MVVYSDVEFVFPKRASNPGRGTRRIFANKKLLLRYDYFEAMFEGGFSEEQGMVESVG